MTYRSKVRGGQVRSDVRGGESQIGVASVCLLSVCNVMYCG